MNSTHLVYLLFLFGIVFSIPTFWTIVEEYFYQKRSPVKMQNPTEAFGKWDEKELLQFARYVDEIVTKNEVYLNSKLSIVLLADLLNEKSSKLSESISHAFGLSFKDYINLKRLDYIEKNFFSSMDGFKKHSLDFISEDAGFGTRKSLYLAIRKLKNCTPLEYFKQQTLAK